MTRAQTLAALDAEIAEQRADQKTLDDNAAAAALASAREDAAHWEGEYDDCVAENERLRARVTELEAAVDKHENPFFIGSTTELPGTTGHRTYYNLSSASSAVTQAKADIAAGRVPCVSFKLPSGVTWAQAAAGSVDVAARGVARDLSALGSRIYVAFHHEPEGDGPIGDWTAMQARLAPIFDLPNLRYSIIVQGYPQLYGPTTYRLDKIWSTLR